MAGRRGLSSTRRVEDAIRFVKQSYNLEDIRVLSRRLKNMVALLLAVIYFNCVWLAGRLALAILTTNITHAAKRIYGVAEFLHYAVADGLEALHAPREMAAATSRQDSESRLRTGLSGMTRFLGKLLYKTAFASRGTV